MNKVILIGRVASDIRFNQTPSGIAYARLTLAVSRRNSNTAKENADFIPMVAWRATATFIGNYVKKGALISIEGSFTSSSYEGPDGKMLRNYEVTIENINLLESKAVVEARNAAHGEFNKNNFSGNFNNNFNSNNSFNQNKKPEFGFGNSYESKNKNEFGSKSEGDFQVQFDELD
ncbi:single-stranded DNA-binding protein [Mycoplasmopsis alligatoris]|uniref:Single-stranded DNA-binding protein n=1 Tax=Mycoplasmopsis alligatoris A21JP2 TaxID=747682 RepID=D4XUZ9_9BACT|nr:single-stranded DNA-binding protein [Mycoplasmopsis alligatoris]EFF41856.1 single-strand binding family protein [Mycoplasmopsis alligatoris A21JP2]